MNNPSPAVQRRTMPLEPRPLRCGDPEYPDKMWDMCLRLVRPPDLGYLRWSPTLPTVGEPHYALDCHSRGRLPCEHFRGPATEAVISEFQNDDRLTTSNLIDLQTKESWYNDRIRADLYSHSLVQYELASFSLQGLDWPSMPSTTTVEPPGKLDEETQHGFPSSLITQAPEECVACNRCLLCRCPSGCLWTPKESPTHVECAPHLRTSGTPDGFCGPFFNDSTTSSSSSSSSSSLSTKATTVQPANTLSNGERIHKCDHLGCPKRFSRKEELARHRRTHSNDRSFECKVCQRRFNRKDHMTKHQATHEDVGSRRRYVCHEPGCERRYTRSDALSRHRSSAHAQPATSTSLSTPFGLGHSKPPVMS